jgi:membrane-associated phospholipid phosphatase
MSEPNSRHHRGLVAAGAAIAVYAAITALVATGWLSGFDLSVRNWTKESTPGWIVDTSGVVAHLGQGGPLAAATLILAVVQVWRTRTLKPFILWGATFALLIALVAPAKVLFRRGAPGDPLATAVEFYSKQFCGGPECQSYPSGHAANSVVWYGLAMVLVAEVLTSAARRVIQVSAATATSVATVVSGHHWLTDTAAGIFAGLGAYFVVRFMQASIRPMTIDKK